MIKIENTHVDNIVRAVYSARNAMNSWNKSDSDLNADTLGKNDLELAKKLSKAGNDHAKFLRMINVTCDITAPLYWYKEYDTYKVGTTANSCSTMHKIHSKEFVLDDFSTEHLHRLAYSTLENVVYDLNYYRELYLKSKSKDYWWDMIQLLPSSYNQLRTVTMNYEVLANIIRQRKNHKLNEWLEFCRVMLVANPILLRLMGDVEIGNGGYEK